MTNGTFRPVRDSDLERLLALNNAAVPEVNELHLEDMVWFAHVSHLFLVADAFEGPAGFLIGLEGPGLDYQSLNYQWFSRNYKRFLYVDRVVVDPAWWGRGIGQGFYGALIASKDNHVALCAEVNLEPRNVRSLDFHRRFGFSPVGEQDTDGGRKRVVFLEYPLESGGGSESVA